MKLNLDRFLNRSTLTGICLAIALAGLSTAFAAKEKTPPAAGPAPATEAVSQDASPAPLPDRSSLGYASVVKRVTPSVVKIFTSTKAKPANLRGHPEFEDGMFRWFFGPQRGRSGPMESFRLPPQRGLGSGVIVTRDGYILTNNHVVDGADEVRVSLTDGREFSAKVVGNDPQTDIAVIKVDARDLPVIALADSDQIEVGDVVLAIGNPFGVGQTVTSGIVSGKGRGNIGLDYEDFIQTDAAINPGNSGGALVDAQGRLIGINTAIISRSGGSQGIGFAIPVNLAHQVMTSLIQDGRVTRGYIGAMIQDVTPALAREFGLKENRGALVGEVKTGGPADKADLQPGDVIVSFNGRNVDGSRNLRLQVAATAPGSTVPMTILRDGEEKTLNLTIKELPGSATLAKARTQAAEDDGVLEGVTVADLDPRVRRQQEVPRNLQGAVVTDVDPNSAAAEAGLRPGDVITEINRRPVRNADEAVRMSENARDKTTLLRVWSESGSRYVVVDETGNG